MSDVIVDPSVVKETLATREDFPRETDEQIQRRLDAAIKRIEDATAIVERAAIVRWLRHGPLSSILHARTFADAIENGEHHVPRRT